MRVLRSTVWAPDLTPAVTVVVRDSDLRVPLEEAMQPVPGTFATYDLFEIENDSTLEATLKANERMTKETHLREKNMAMLFYYNLFSPQFELVPKGGVITQTRPSPLSVVEIKSVFEQIAIHPTFKDKPVTMLALSERMKMVTLTPDGQIKEG